MMGRRNFCYRFCYPNFIPPRLVSFRGIQPQAHLSPKTLTRRHTSELGGTAEIGLANRLITCRSLGEIALSRCQMVFRENHCGDVLVLRLRTSASE
jgi:hypothetical protein